MVELVSSKVPTELLDSMMIKPSLTILVLCLTLGACSTSSISDWPRDIPPQALFIEAYQADARNQQLQTQNEYLEWIIGFYEGTLLYPTGWQDVETQLLQGTPVSERPGLQSRLTELGVVIGSEWAKDNDVRLINNRLLALWGSTLQLMVGPEQQLLAIEEIERDIDLLLLGTLQKEDVREARYAETLGFEVFGDF
ncbi:MAG: hypothetical protein RKH07_14035 [Gammaproteobacteria bacterium]